MNVLSLFSGCGGMDIGFEGGFQCLSRSINNDMHADWVEENLGEWVNLRKTGFKTVFANDIKPDAKSAWLNYFSKHRCDLDDVYHLESIVDLVRRAKKGEKIFPENIDVVTGGFPCQDFSVAGKRNGFNSTKSHNGKVLEIDAPSVESRGQLYMWMREVISLTQPTIFIAENVKGLTNLNDVQKIIEKDFSEAAKGGYLVMPAKVLHAADFGVPQSRERVIFYGFKKSALTREALQALTLEEVPALYNPYPSPTHSYTVESSKLCPPVTCIEAFIGLGEPELSDDKAQQKYSKAKFMGKHCQGQSEIKLDSIAPTIRSEHHGNIEFRRLSLENGGVKIDELNKGMKERRLTVRECARIQTFPDDYEFILPKTGVNVPVSASAAYKLVGNAVPCLLAYHIAMTLKDKWSIYFGR
ncbi:DNA cytosine methyltransferase [Moraxella bovoculi]|uniref:DNA cytosine methyltransferase n=1 Tax=Moraxella bovoculi TaxID=386891 RepID=UPI000624871A|nr:DNA (cytosine-5-)-methyltransferase [Moraxella bovoculi]AKG15980.2 modification methylase [Moraxella bovoculi]AKG17666.1 DNA (cytosine-5-)-methyltransferase [Moraxella bovoculi]